MMFVLRCSLILVLYLNTVQCEGILQPNAHTCPCFGFLPFGEDAGDTKTTESETVVDLDVSYNIRGSTYDELEIHQSGKIESVPNESGETELRLEVYQDPSLGDGCHVFFRQTEDDLLLDSLSTLVQCKGDHPNFCALHALVVTWVDISDHCKPGSDKKSQGNTFQAVIVTNGVDQTYTLMNYANLETVGEVSNRFGVQPTIDTFYHPFSEMPDELIDPSDCCPGLFLFDFESVPATTDEAFGTFEIFPGEDGCDDNCDKGCLIGKTADFGHDGGSEEVCAKSFVELSDDDNKCIKKLKMKCGKHALSLEEHTQGSEMDCTNMKALIGGACDKVQCYDDDFIKCTECTEPICEPFQNNCPMVMK